MKKIILAALVLISVNKNEYGTCRKARALVPTCQDGVGFLTERRLLRQGRSMIEGEWVVRRESVLCPKSSQKDNSCPKELNH